MNKIVTESHFLDKKLIKLSGSGIWSFVKEPQSVTSSMPRSAMSDLSL